MRKSYEPLTSRELEEVYDRHDNEDLDGFVGSSQAHEDVCHLLATIQWMQDRIDYMNIRMSNARFELDLDWNPEDGYAEKVATNGGYIHADPKIPILGEDDE